MLPYRFLPLFFTLAPLALTACGDDAPTEDAGHPRDAAVHPDAAVTSEDGGAPDSGQDAGAPLGPEPIEIAISATGHDRLLGAAHDSTGRLYVTGYVSDSTVAPDFEMVLGRLLPSGMPDPSFGTNGFTRVNVVTAGSGEVARGIVVQSDGKIVISGTVEDMEAADPRDRNIALIRFDDDGTLDSDFGDEGVAIFDFSLGEVVGDGYVADSTWGLSLYANGDLLLIGSLKAEGRTDSDYYAARVTTDGALDDEFATNGVFTLDVGNNDASPRTATILADGSAIVAGYMNADGVVSPVIYKLDAEGELDPSFGVNGVYTEVVLGAVTEAYAAALQGTSLITSGYGRDGANDDLDWISLRITPAGTRDETYGTSGVAAVDLAGNNDNARTLVILPDDRVLLVGGGRPTTDNSDGMIAVLTADGALDTSFGDGGRMVFDFGGVSDFFWGASLAPDGSHVLLAGTKQVAGDSGGDDDGVVLILPLE